MVIEASHRSGSKITAKYAKNQGKKIYCIPINLDQKNSSGVVELLKEGARIVTSPIQILEDLYSRDKEKRKEITRNIEDVPNKYAEIYTTLEDIMSSEELAIKLNKNIDEINSILTMMEIDGYIKRLPGNNFTKKEKNV